MKWLRRQPRSVYRVYSEEDYFDGVEPLLDWQAGDSVADDPSENTPIAELAATPAADVRVTDDVQASKPVAPKLRRFAAGAALAGAVVLIGGLIAAVVPPGRRPVVRHGLAPRVVSVPSAATAPSVATAHAPAVPRVRRASASGHRSARSRRPAPPCWDKARARAPAGAARESHGGPIPVAAEPGSPESSRPVPVVAEIGAPSGSVTVAAIVPAAAPVGELARESAAAREFAPSSQLSAQIEFGFERR